MLVLPRTAFNLAPLPKPDVSITSKEGVEKYSVPAAETDTDDIPVVDGSIKMLIAAFLPFLILRFGFLSKFKIWDPYPVPLFVNKRSSISPLTTGVISSVVFAPPTWMYSILAFISGYLNVWVPIPAVVKLTKLLCSKLVESVPPRPAFANPNSFSFIFRILYCRFVSKPSITVPVVE